MNYDNSLVVTITVTCNLWAPSSGGHLWRHLPAATDAYFFHNDTLLLLFDSVRTATPVLSIKLTTVATILTNTVK